MKKGLVVFIILICSALTVYGASDDADLGLWQSFGVDFKPAKGFKLYLEKQLRCEDKFTNMESDISEVGLRYKASGFLQLRVNYRFVSRSGEKRDRFDGNVYLNLRLNAVKISNRTRLQQEFIETLESSESELDFRNRLRITFTNSKKIQPFLGGEVFIGLGDGGDKRNKFRLTAGADWAVTKPVTLTAFYHYQRELEKDNPDTSHIFGLKFNYSF